MAKAKKNEKVDLIDMQRISVDKEPVRYWLDTGCTLLNIAISGRIGGGFPAGKISHIVGLESSGKSVFAQAVIASAQQQGGIGMFVDSEGTLDFIRAEELFKVETDQEKGNFVYVAPEFLTVEDMYDSYIDAMINRDRSVFKGPSVVSIDSYTGIPSKVETETNLDEGTYGTSRAKQSGAGMRKILAPLHHSDLSLVFVDQYRMNVGGYGATYTVSGGKALDFYASIQVELKKKSTIKNKHDRAIGAVFGFKLKKNKVGIPYTEGNFYLYFNYGIDNTETNIQFLLDNQVGDTPFVKKAGSWVTVGEEKVQGVDKACNIVEEKGLQERVEQEVLKVWGAIHEDDRHNRISVV